MAGLQYNFFPTDFFFPPQRSINGDTTGQKVLPVKTLKKDDIDDSKQSTTLVRHDINKKNLKVFPSSSTALAPIHKQNQNGPQ